MTLTDGGQYRNLVDCDIADYLDKDDFLARLKAGDYTGKLRAILHQGACSDTMEHNGKYMMEQLSVHRWTCLTGVRTTACRCCTPPAPPSTARAGVQRITRTRSPLNVYGYSKFSV